MKKIMFCLIASLVCSFAVQAQQKSALEAYTKWKKVAFEHLDKNTIHYSLATLTQRVDSKTAKINFVVVGQIPSLNLEIRPFKIQKNAKHPNKFRLD